MRTRHKVEKWLWVVLLGLALGGAGAWRHTVLSNPLGPALDKPAGQPRSVRAKVVVLGPDAETSPQMETTAENAGTLPPSAPQEDSATVAPGTTSSPTPTCQPSTPAPSRVMQVPDMVWVTLPGGVFKMGSAKGKRNEQPVHRVIVGAFEISKTEVTVRQYRLCVAAGACSEPETRWEGCNWGREGREEHPVNCVDWSQAVQFAQWVGGRLPTEAEWEFAARSRGQEHTFPWGEAPPTCERAVIPGPSGNGCGRLGTWPVCSKPEGNTEQGLCDMAGNVWEWVADWYQEDYYAHSPTDNPQGPAWAHYRVARGGSWFPPATYVRTTARYGDRPGGKRFDLGFRVVRDVVWNP